MTSLIEVAGISTLTKPNNLNRFFLLYHVVKQASNSKVDKVREKQHHTLDPGLLTRI